MKSINGMLIASYICKECGKDINSNKCIKIGKNTYHMVCGLNVKFGNVKEKDKICQKDVILNG